MSVWKCLVGGRGDWLVFPCYVENDLHYFTNTIKFQMTHSHLHPITSNWLNQWATNIIGSTIFKYNTVDFHLFLLILFHGSLFNHKTKNLQPTVTNQSNKQFKTIINNRFIFPQEQKWQLQFYWRHTFLCKRPHTCKQTCISFSDRDWQSGILEKLILFFCYGESSLKSLQLQKNEVDKQQPKCDQRGST